MRCPWQKPLHTQTIGRVDYKVQLVSPPEELTQLDLEYTKYLGGIIKTFIEENNIKDLDAVCSHGHTVLHRPDQGSHITDW